MSRFVHVGLFALEKILEGNSMTAVQDGRWIIGFLWEMNYSHGRDTKVQPQATSSTATQWPSESLGGIFVNLRSVKSRKCSDPVDITA